MQTPTAVAVDGVIPLGSLIRRYGCDVALNGNAVNITGAGYYDADASATASATAAANGTVDLSIPALVRQVCCAEGSALTLVLAGAAATVNNVALRVQRI